MRKILFVMQLKLELHSDSDKLPQQAFSPEGARQVGSYQGSRTLPFLYLGQVLSLPTSHRVPAE